MYRHSVDLQFFRIQPNAVHRYCSHFSHQTHNMFFAGLSWCFGSISRGSRLSSVRLSVYFVPGSLKLYTVYIGNILSCWLFLFPPTLRIWHSKRYSFIFIRSPILWIRLLAAVWCAVRYAHMHNCICVCNCMCVCVWYERAVHICAVCDCISH